MSKKKSPDSAEESKAAQTASEPTGKLANEPAKPAEKLEDAAMEAAAEATAETSGAHETADVQNASANDAPADNAGSTAEDAADANAGPTANAGQPDDGIDAEIAEAEAALRAAQERLEAARAKRGVGAPTAAGDGAHAATGVAAEAASTGADSANATADSSVPPWTPYSTGGAYVGPDPASTAYTAPAYGATASVPGYTAPQQGYVPPSYATGSTQAQPQPQSPNANPGTVPPQTPPYYGYQQPYYQQPYAQPVVSTKDHVAAGLLAIFLGWLGIHKFYLGYNTAGFIMLGVSILGGILTLSLASWVIWVIAIIEGIMYFTKSQTEFEQTYVLRRREWF